MILDAEISETSTLFPEDGPIDPPTGTAVLATLEELRIVGMWEDRTDIDDSGEFARDLRERSQVRRPE
ncbi:MAG: hypothetical protein V2B18_00730 [Pseudomonadota bacterium]